MVFQASGNQMKAGMAILILVKIDFKPKLVKREKLGHYMMIKGSIYQEDIIVNLYAPNIEAPEYIKQILTDLKGEIDNTIMVGKLIPHCQQRIDHPNRKSTKKHWD